MFSAAAERVEPPLARLDARPDPRLGSHGDVVDPIERRLLQAQALVAQGQFVKAASELGFAVRLGGRKSPAVRELAELLSIQGRSEEALAYLRRSVRGAQPDAGIWQDYLSGQIRVQSVGAQEVTADHIVWGAGFAARREKIKDPKDRNRSAPRLRIAYLSGYFNREGVAPFVLPAIVGHDRSKVEVWCYGAGGPADDYTDAVRNAADIWLDVGDLNDEVLASRIAADRIDVLIELGGHRPRGRLGVMAYRPAPLQASYFGYPATSGLAEIDIRFTDGFADPEPADLKLSSERLLRLPRPFVGYFGEEGAPPVAERASRSQSVTFGWIGDLSRIAPTTLDLWSELLSAIPQARLLLVAPGFADREVGARFSGLMAARGVSSNRLQTARTPQMLQERLKLYGLIDVALDAAPENDPRAIMDALWMGVPAISFAGDRHAGRLGRSLLGGVGLGKLAQSTSRGFIAAGQSLVEDKSVLQSLRKRLRGKIGASALGDQKALARALEDIIFAAWRGELSRVGQ